MYQLIKDTLHQFIKDTFFTQETSQRNKILEEPSNATHEINVQKLYLKELSNLLLSLGAIRVDQHENHQKLGSSLSIEKLIEDIGDVTETLFPKKSSNSHISRQILNQLQAAKQQEANSTTISKALEDILTQNEDKPRFVTHSAISF